MYIKILNGKWKINVVTEDLYGVTHFPDRVINLGTEIGKDKQLTKYVVMHEVTHAIQAELGQWQNVMSNGKMNDEFDCEFIAEFVAIYSEYIIKLSNDIINKLFK